MKNLISTHVIAGLFAFTSLNALSATIDFSSYPVGTALSGPINGVSFALIGGNEGGAIPTVGSSFLDPSRGITNTPNSGEYPTANILQFSFEKSVSDVSFSFDNESFGSCPGRGCSFISAFDSAGNTLEVISGADGNVFEDLQDYSFISSGIKTIQFNNGSDEDWWFYVSDITYTSAVPVPASAWLFGSALAGLGFARRKK